MRVLRLRFKNLNSLAGVWDIDFTHPDYVSSGIFAIIGPTGAGKTTILDAICLALYGRTPRLERITQSDNEIMSRQTGECFAEIEFETARGRFRCHWSQHRSRRMADGLLQSPRHEIAEAESGLILESKLKAVAVKVEDVTGMDFDRFTRSMLLAQGGFAAFLQANPDQRAPILEQITGTEIYSRISIKVHERTSDERRKLTELRAELDGIQLLTPQEEQALRSELAERQTQETALVADVRIVQEARSWRERMAALEGELLQLDQDWQDFAVKKELAAPELERLALAARALKIAGEHAHLGAVRKQQEAEQAELKNIEERLPRLQLSWQAAFDELEQAELTLGRAGVEQAQGAGLIRATRELDVRLGESLSRLKGLADDIENVRRQSGGYRHAMTASDQRLSEIGMQLGTVAALLDEHRADAGLSEALTGIEQQLRTCKTLDQQCRANRDKLSRQAAVISNARLALDQAETVWKGAVQAVTEAEGGLVTLCSSRQALLQGRELSALRDQAETVATRIGRLATIDEAVGRIGESGQRQAELTLRVAELEQKQCNLLQQQEKLAGEHELREQLVCQLQDKVVLLNRVRDLEAERAQLVDGVPCPLCGSSEHPYAVGNVPQPDEVQKELEQALAESKMVGKQLADNGLELVAVGKDLELARRDRLECQGRMERDETFCRGAFAELGLNVVSGAWPDAVRQETEAGQGLLVSLRGVINGAEQIERSEQAARAVLDKARDDLSRQEKARLAAALGHASALTELKRLEDESAVLRDDLDRALAAVERAVEPYGCDEIVPGKADQMLAALTVRRNAWLQWTKTGENFQKELTEIAAGKEKQQALLAEAERVLAEREQQLQTGTVQRDGLVEQRLELYGERNPDLEEKRLAEALRQAGQRREELLRESNKLRSELDMLHQQLEKLSGSTRERAGQLAGLEAALALRLTEAGFADEASFVQACLPQQRYDELVQWAENLGKQETVLRTRRQDRSEALAAEQDRNLTDKTLEQIREEHESVAGRLSDLQKTLGALDHKLRQHVEQQQRHHSRLQEIDVCKRECERWDRLHALIGSGDGKKFRNFAQGLTFELMVAHANRQLQKMSDRYILVRDSLEPLELNVIDNYRAGDIRSTRNLSGGESFIASLALSLGLSSMASRNVRVDSLFLDEGFGTLDEDALETALETLSALQQEGKLIGIISHVPALKERIGTQIQVEAGSAGRSSLSGPGCSSI
ncbi:MAG: AAA family ATPase [Steroidobacteraceae bacterium]|nr:AAA family ATPase [Deltaproteobacteria bacterium]